MFSKYKFIGILGLGISGGATYHYLKSLGYKLIVWDDKSTDIAIKEDVCPPEHDDWNHIDLLILSPGIPHKHPTPHPLVKKIIAKNVDIVCDIEILYQLNHQANFIAITGTNGKSTTTSLIYHILGKSGINCQLGGNIGNAALNLKQLKNNECYVIECSSFQLELLDKFKAKIAILLNITPDHLDRYESMDDYIQAKLNIFKNQDYNDYAVICIDQDITSKIYNDLLVENKNAIAISIKNELEEGAYIKDNSIIWPSKSIKAEIPSNKFLKGLHNQENLLASFVCAVLLGINPNLIIQNISTFVGLPHRMEFVCEKNDIKYVDDSKATNLESAAKALSAYDNILWIVGGYQKGEVSFDVLLPFIQNVKKAYLMGSSSNIVAKFLENKCQFEFCNTLETAMLKIKMEAVSGDTVLLSPGFASFDQFKNFMERGVKFKNLIT
jgi:UDP-N-acetylmuramoylalanine--D-glutamate ligase